MHHPPRLINRWTVDYGHGEEPHEVTVPHAWGQDVDVRSEGPVVYRSRVDVPYYPTNLRFHGVSYAAEILIDGQSVAVHHGIWDAFDVPLFAYAGRSVDVEVRVVKNGGPTFPVREVASGFLPYVFNTFGGIYKDVELVVSSSSPQLPTSGIFEERVSAPIRSRIAVEGYKLFLDGQPFYLRGLLHWGWYPDVGHPNPPAEEIREEVQMAKDLGFNTVKFCLWVPPHSYLEILREEGMVAWMELPLWDPTDDPVRQRQIADEIERIVRQYRHHDNIVVWTVGCELSGATDPDYRRHLTQMVRNLTGCPLVKDNSGGAEMYGGDLREFGDFYDFHPYCDTHYYPPVLDTLLPGPRQKLPILLGEFNDIDVHRDLATLADQMPYWASTLSELNAQGVRWQYDLPTVLPTCRFAQEPQANRHTELMASSRDKALFMRKTVHEAVRARDPIAGYVVTGWRDTPISSSGFFDDHDAPRWTADECAAWNGDACVFLIPIRRPPWVHGGNRPGFLDPLNHFTGQVFWRVGVHSAQALRGGLVWRILDSRGSVIARGAETNLDVPALESTEVGQIHWECDQPGQYVLELQFGQATNRWPIHVVTRLGPEELEAWRKHDPAGVFSDLKASEGDHVLATEVYPNLTVDLQQGRHVVLFLQDRHTSPMPFWREAAYEFNDSGFWDRLRWRDAWERFLPVSPDRTIDSPSLVAQLGTRDALQPLMLRIDTRTYAEAPVVARLQSGGSLLVTTLRPQNQSGVLRNPAGVALLRALLQECGGQ